MWLEHYTQNCGEPVAEETLKFIQRVDSDNAESICDTPMGLYMVTANKFNEGELENQWALYHRIFSKEQRRTDYNPTYSPPAEENENLLRTEHSAYEHWENIYRLSEEIAWYQYQNRNADLAVPGDSVREALERLGLENEDTKNLLEGCFALCGYWKPNPDRGCVEFYHNNIRDFFLCEKIMRELNEGYEKDLTTPNGDLLPFLKRLTGLLRYGPLEQRVLDFLRQRAEYRVKKGSPDLCVQREKKGRFLPRLYETLLLQGELYTDTVNPDENPIHTVTGILRNVFSVYTQLYFSFLKVREHIRWWTDKNKINKSGIFRMVAVQILKYAPFSDLSGADLRRADLRRVSLLGARLSGAVLQGAVLSGANSNNADLSNVDLSDARLSGAVLSGVNLSGAVLQGAVLSGANLNNTDLSNADLSNVDLSNAVLSDCNVSNADMDGCYLRNAELYGSNLRKARNVPEKYLPRDTPSADVEV